MRGRRHNSSTSYDGGELRFEKCDSYKQLGRKAKGGERGKPRDFRAVSRGSQPPNLMECSRGGWPRCRA